MLRNHQTWLNCTEVATEIGCLLHTRVATKHSPCFNRNVTKLSKRLLSKDLKECVEILLIRSEFIDTLQSEVDCEDAQDFWWNAKASRSWFPPTTAYGKSRPCRLARCKYIRGVKSRQITLRSFASNPGAPNMCKTKAGSIEVFPRQLETCTGTRKKLIRILGCGWKNAGHTIS